MATTKGVGTATELLLIGPSVSALHAALIEPVILFISLLVHQGSGT